MYDQCFREWKKVKDRVVDQVSDMIDLMEISLKKLEAAVDYDDTVVGIECYQLESVCRLRKYLSFVELGLSFLTSRVVFVSGWSELVKAQVLLVFIRTLTKCNRKVHYTI